MGKSFESVGAMWSATDEQFFRCTAGVFQPDFLWGAGALLGSYDLTGDDEPVPAQLRGPAEPGIVGALAPRPVISVRAAHLPPCG
jgi:hypothetical protein